MILEVVGLEICVPDLIWTIIDFFILYFLLKRFLYRPILRFMEKRDNLISEGIKQGEQAIREQKEAEAESLDAIKAYHAEAVKQISKARSQSEEERKTVLDQAAKDSLLIRENMHEKLKQEEMTARRLSEERLQDYVSILTEKLLSSRS